MSRTLVSILSIAFVWVALLCLANPTGEFPLNDDWNYARSAKILAESSQLLITCWNCSTNLVQITYGALLTNLLGFSFTLLRATSWVAGLIGCVYMYLLLRETSKNEVIGLAAAGTLMTNVIYFNLANTFMTDVPFMAALLAGSYYAVRSLRNERTRDFVLAVLCLVVSTFLRQYGIILLVLFLIASIYRRLQNRRLLIVGFVTLALTFGSLLFFREWLQSTGLPGCYAVWSTHLQNELSKGILPFIGIMLSNLIAEAVYLGAFIFPFILVITPAIWQQFDKNQKRFAVICGAEIFIASVIGLALKRMLMPITTNVISSDGVGPVLFTHAAPSTHYLLFWILITLLSCAGLSAASALLLTSAVKRLAMNRIAVMFGSFLVIYLVTLAFTGLIDRYILPAVPLLCVLLSLLIGNTQINLTNRPILILSALTFVWIASLCVASTHDYFALNRARWEAIDYARNQMKISPEQIDGGWEYNGWLTYEPEHISTAGKDLWLRHGDAYAVSNFVPQHFSPIKEWHYLRWLTANNGTIYLLRKEHDDSTH